MAVSDNLHRFTISVDKDLLQRVDERREVLGVTRSAYISCLLSSYELQLVKVQDKKRANYRAIKRKYKKRRS